MGCVFCVVGAKELSWRQLALQLQFRDIRRTVTTWAQKLEIFIVKVCYQETISENIAEE
jgi:hypothetical protein